MSIDRPIRINVNAAIMRNGKILVIEFNDESGVHYNLPGGGVNRGESLVHALRRECLEETGAKVVVGRQVLLWEYVPELQGSRFGATQKVGLIFQAELESETPEPCLPKGPDLNQTAVKWVPLEEIVNAGTMGLPPLLPNVGNELMKALTDQSAPIHVLSGV